jgi:hypothetical protein
VPRRLSTRLTAACDGLWVASKILPATDEAGNVMDKHKLLACLFVNDEPLASKSKADQRMVLCELLRDSSPKLCSEDTDCLCAKGSMPPSPAFVSDVLRGCSRGQMGARVVRPALARLPPVLTLLGPPYPASP